MPLAAGGAMKVPRAPPSSVELLATSRRSRLGTARRTKAPLRRTSPGAAAPRKAWPPLFHDIYLSHFDYVRLALLRLGVHEVDVLDLVQTVFATVCAKLPTFQRRCAIKTWLFDICRNTAGSYRYVTRSRQEVLMEWSVLGRYPALEPVESTESFVSSRDMRAQAEAILDNLPEAQRVVFVLFELEELSGVEIAQKLGVSVGTVRSRLRLARTRFARLRRAEKR
jgi:RNA polymerase sigma-70 factor (ECF subfamily)